MKIIHVVALALENDKGEILVTQRANDKHQGGLWEFPGGKLEQDESRFEGLKREIKEELDYSLKSASPLRCITHEYSDLTVKLDVWYSKVSRPDVKANENQPMKWVSYQQLKELAMPAADRPIIEALLDR